MKGENAGLDFVFCVYRADFTASLSLIWSESLPNFSVTWLINYFFKSALNTSCIKVIHNSSSNRSPWIRPVQTF